MNALAKRLALTLGWREAHDADEGYLVVFHEGWGVHFTGTSAWRDAALYSFGGDR